MENDAIYYSRRAHEERKAASIAGSDEARDAHLKLADAYDLRVRDIVRLGGRQHLAIVNAAA